MLGSIRRSLGLKLVLAVGIPSLGFTALLVLWLQHEAGEHSPALASAHRVAFGALLAFTALIIAAHALAMRLLVEHPIQRLAAGLRRARDGDFLHRIPVESEDELGALARDFNRTLAAITDLHARRLDDAASMESMQRELALKAELEARVKELTLLFDLSRRLSASLELDRLLDNLSEVVGRALGDHAFAILLAEEGTGDLVVRSVSGVGPEVIGTRVSAGEGPGGWAARGRETILVRDTRADGRRPSLPWQRGDGSILAVPLVHQDEAVGVFAFFRPAPDAFPDAEVRLIESAAGQAATALENARLHQKMVRLSQTDALTGVHNRRSLFARLAMEGDRCERFDHPVAVALVDVDHFKAFNDAFGHAAGDGILRRVAELLQGSVRKVDLVARYGGEEFAVVLPRADRAAAIAAAEKLREAIAAAAVPHGASPAGRVTVSVGIAAWPEDARDTSTLIDCADAALFAAKRAGRNVVRPHEPGMRGDPGRRRDLSTTGDAEARAR